jgi:N-acetylglucosaminyldiphosphoundecaprenol N-acetyl-beta-D-mannosaminyltransferase
VTSAEELCSRVVAWAVRGQSRCVCFSPADHFVRAQDAPGFRAALEQADWIAPDGMAVVWSLRLLGRPDARRVYGPDAMLVLLDAAARSGIPVGFYGATPETLRALLARVRTRFPRVRIAYAWAPPFRALTPQENEEAIGRINASGARILFVGLGTPKQELWMAAHRGRVRAVMLGVGAAFDYLAGAKRQAPRWLMPLGLEWLFRLTMEPRRLWRRYLLNNPRFVRLVTQELLRRRFNSGPNGSAAEGRPQGGESA